MIPDEEREWIVGACAHSEWGSRRIARSMVEPLQSRLGRGGPISAVYENVTDPTWVPKRVLTAGPVSHLVTWGVAGPLASLEKAMDRAKHKMSAELAEPLFEYLRSAPLAGDANPESLLRVAATLTSEAGGEERRPLLMMDARTYVALRRTLAGLRIDEECQRARLRLGLAGTLEGCSVVVFRGVSPGEVVVVSRHPDQVLGPVRVVVEVTEHASRSWDSDGRLGLRFGASWPISDWPDAARLRVG